MSIKDEIFSGEGGKGSGYVEFGMIKQVIKVKRVYVTGKEPTTKRSNSKKYLEEHISILDGLEGGGIML